MIFPSGNIGSAAIRTPENTVLKSGSLKGATIETAMANAELIVQCVNEREAMQAVCEAAKAVQKSRAEYGGIVAPVSKQFNDALAALSSIQGGKGGVV